ncbi:unnamed protein product [Linum tenue]|uniref:Uncharacterized protein n=1 Tax=Linum tenue TaxID=586396 RepID=A0AAV0N340_9ROSI|nr:unnamed protein product [Linum tenue]
MGIKLSINVNRSEFLDYLQLVQLYEYVDRIVSRHGSFLDHQFATDPDFRRRVVDLMARIKEIRGKKHYALERKLLHELCETYEDQVGGARTDYQYRLYPAAGAVAIALSKTFTAPLARLTILSQVAGMHYQSTALMKGRMLWEARRIVGEEGFRALWKGNLASVVHRVLFAGVIMLDYEDYRKNLGRVIGGTDANSTGLVNLIAGGLTGIEATCITYSLDMVRTRVAAQRNSIYGLRGTWHAFYDVHSANGFLPDTMFKGLGATLLGTVPSMAISFFVYESFKSFLKARRPGDDSPITVGLACGSIAGLAASTATYPIDLVRRRMQLDGIGGRAPIYTSGVRETFKTIIRKEGFRGLYRGIFPQCLRVVPGHAVAFMSFEMMKMSIATYGVIKSQTVSS